MIFNVGHQNPYQQMEDITLCRSCFCYASVNGCGRVWQQYFTICPLCKDKKQWPWWHWTKLCYLRANTLFKWQHFHFTCLITWVWLITPHFWPHVCVGGLRVTVGRPRCSSLLGWTPIQDSSNPNAAAVRCKGTHCQDLTCWCFQIFFTCTMLRP